MKDNKIIAEFMGYDISTSLRDGVECVEYAEDNIRALSDTHYHNSWDWLIPVVQRLIDVYWSIDEQDEQDLQQSILNDRIGVVYQIVVEIIKQYNSEDRG